MLKQSPAQFYKSTGIKLGMNDTKTVLNLFVLAIVEGGRNLHLRLKETVDEELRKYYY